MIPNNDEAENNAEDEVVDALKLMIDAGCDMQLAFHQKRHQESITSDKTVTQTWRMKERVSNF